MAKLPSYAAWEAVTSRVPRHRPQFPCESYNETVFSKASSANALEYASRIHSEASTDLRGLLESSC